MTRLQDRHGPLRRVAVFHDGQIIGTAPDDESAQRLRNELATDHPGCEVLALCLAHPGRAAVDCLDCWPEESGVAR